jgi:transposase
MSQITLLTGPERRRKWHAEERLLILNEAFAPGAVTSEVARRHDVATSVLYAWRKAALAQQQGPSFSPVVIKPDAPGQMLAGKAPVITVDLSGARVSISATASPGLVAATLKALR